MSIFNFSQEEILSFFAVLVRFSVLIAVLPFVGDRAVPTAVKVLLALSVTIALFPALVASGEVRPGEAIAWGATTAGIVGTVTIEALVGLILGFTARFSFDAISFGANLVGNYMGFASASTYDPHQESQTQIVAEFQMALAMLLFLALDGHHLMLAATLDSYRILGLGKAAFGAAMSARLVDLTSEVIRFGMILSAPLAVSLFAVNVVFGVLAKAMPQLNLLVLSFAITAFVGFFVMLISVPEFHGVAGNIMGRMGDNLISMLTALKGK